MPFTTISMRPGTGPGPICPILTPGMRSSSVERRRASSAWAFAAARQTAISKALKKFMAISLELRVEVELQAVYPQRRSLDLVGRDKTHREPGIQGQAVSAAEDPASGVRASEVEVRIGEGVEHRVASDLLVREGYLPFSLTLDHRASDGELDLAGVHVPIEKRKRR